MNSSVEIAFIEHVLLGMSWLSTQQPSPGLHCGEFSHFVDVSVVYTPREDGLLPSPGLGAWASVGLSQAYTSLSF